MCHLRRKIIGWEGMNMSIQPGSVKKTVRLLSSAVNISL